MNKAFRLPDNYKPYLDERNKRILEMISPEKNHKILVIGTGVYPKTEFFLFHNFKCKNVFSIDIDKDNLDRAREILPELNFLYANAQKKLPFENREFDVVVMTEVLEHLKDERLILKEIRRVLKKNGALVLSVPKRRWFNIFSPITHVQHIREYCEKRIIQTLEKNGFSVRMMFVGGTFLEIVNLWIHLLLKYGLGHVSPDIFFGKVIDKTYKRGFKGAGFDIILRAELSSSL